MLDPSPVLVEVQGDSLELLLLLSLYLDVALSLLGVGQVLFDVGVGVRFVKGLLELERSEEFSVGVDIEEFADEGCDVLVGLV